GELPLRREQGSRVECVGEGQGAGAHGGQVVHDARRGRGGVPARTNLWREEMNQDPTASGRDDQYVEIILAPLRKSADYLPKMGGSGEVDLEGFTGLYGAVPLYHWLGLDSPLMFAAH